MNVCCCCKDHNVLQLQEVGDFGNENFPPVLNPARAGFSALFNHFTATFGLVLLCVDVIFHNTSISHCLLGPNFVLKTH